MSKECLPIPRGVSFIVFRLQVQDSIVGVLAAHTATKQEAITAWEGEKRKVSK